MSQASIHNLLRRKKLKGEEIGRILLLSFIADYKHRGETKYLPLFTQQQLNRMVSALPSDHERQIYAEYVDLY